MARALIYQVFQIGRVGLNLDMIRSTVGSDKKSNAKQPVLTDTRPDPFVKTSNTKPSDASAPASQGASLFLLIFSAAMQPPARIWRMFKFSSVYYCLLFITVFTIEATIGTCQYLPRIITFIITSILLAPLHMLWTHAAIISQFDEPSLSHLRRNYRMLTIPSLANASSQALTVLAPFRIAWSLPGGHWVFILQRVLAGVGSAAVLTLCVLLPNSIALTRVEAALLPLDTTMLVKPVAFITEHSMRKYDSIWAGAFVPWMLALRSIDLGVLWKVFKQFLLWNFYLVCAVGVHLSGSR